MTTDVNLYIYWTHTYALLSDVCHRGRGMTRTSFSGRGEYVVELGDKRTLFGLFRHVYRGFTVGNGVFLATR